MIFPSFCVEPCVHFRLIDPFFVLLLLLFDNPARFDAFAFPLPLHGCLDGR